MTAISCVIRKVQVGADDKERLQRGTVREVVQEIFRDTKRKFIRIFLSIWWKFDTDSGKRPLKQFTSSLSLYKIIQCPLWGAGGNLPPFQTPLFYYDSMLSNL